MPPSDDKPAWWRVLVGAAFVILGALVLVPSGLCTAFMGITALAQLVSAPHALLANVRDFWPVVVGAPVVALIGYALVRLGIAVGRGRS